MSTLSLFLAFSASACGSQFETETPGPPAGTVPVGLLQVADGLAFPLYLTAPPGDPRLFVVEKGGTIRIIESGTLLPLPFLDLTGKVSTGGEQGLLGLAFDPAYATTGRFIVHYTDSAGDTRVSAFHVSADPDRADPTTEVAILTVDQPFANHNGGQIAFGPDGFLYLGLGDGGSEGDPNGTGQSLGDLLGDIVRISVAGPGGYTIPPDNPFVGVSNARGEVWSYGLRNPWRFSFDRLTGDLYIGDVGQSRLEEIDVAPAAAGGGRGVNYGWKVMEGSSCYGTTACDTTGLALPVLEYDHGQGCSITGGYVYRGAAIPALQGQYFYADYCSGFVRSVRVSGGAAGDQADWPTLRPGGAVPSFGEDAAGELYVLSAAGGVFKIVPR